eukprot:scaffold2592_cov395-Prasinococcus_capsulatus_cf.AAC.13
MEAACLARQQAAPRCKEQPSLPLRVTTHERAATNPHYCLCACRRMRLRGRGVGQPQPRTAAQRAGA